jgi:hypothetical protein
MNKKEVTNIVLDVFNSVLNRHLFEMDTAERRRQIMYEFVDECALLGHGVQVDEIVDEDSFKGLSFMHEKGYSGTIKLAQNLASVSLDNDNK